MKHWARVQVGGLVVFLAGMVAPAWSQEEAAGGFEIGTRITHVILLDDKQGTENSGSFMGTITELKDEQDYLPYKIYVQYRVQPWLAVGASFDRFGGKTWEGDRPNGETDGTVWLSGPLAYVSGRYLNETIFTPYAEIGVAYYTVTFDSEGWDGDVDVDDATGLYLAGGCETAFAEHWSMDVYARYMNVQKSEGEWSKGRSGGDAEFTMTHLALGLGVKYAF